MHSHTASSATRLQKIVEPELTQRHSDAFTSVARSSGDVLCEYIKTRRTARITLLYMYVFCHKNDELFICLSHVNKPLTYMKVRPENYSFSHFMFTHTCRFIFLSLLFHFLSLLTHFLSLLNHFLSLSNRFLSIYTYFSIDFVSIFVTVESFFVIVNLFFVIVISFFVLVNSFFVVVISFFVVVESMFCTCKNA